MDMQNLVEEYRMMLQDFFSWLDALIKRAENADKGKGNNIAQRVALLEQLTAETSQGKPKLSTLNTKVSSSYSRQTAISLMEIFLKIKG